MKWIKHPTPNQAKTWVLFGKTNRGYSCVASLFKLVSSPKLPFRWRLPESNPTLEMKLETLLRLDIMMLQWLLAIIKRIAVCAKGARRFGEEKQRNSSTQEDDCRIRKENGAENVGIIR